MKKTLAIIMSALLLGSVLLSGCGTARTEPTKLLDSNTENSSVNSVKDNTDEKISAKDLNDSEKTSVRLGINSFSAKLFKEEYSQNSEKKNLLLSPLSVYTGFSFLNNGTNGSTYDEIITALSSDGVEAATGDNAAKPLETDILNGYFSYYLNGLDSDGNEFAKLDMANSFWAIERENTKVKDDFINAGRSFYGAEVWNKPFGKSVVKNINNWVSDNTDKMIDRILDDNAVTKDTVAVLLNAVAFDAEWNEPYNDYNVHEFDFHNYDGTTSKVDFMSGESYGYIDDGYSLGFVKDYRAAEGNETRYCFVAILPNEDVGIAEYIEKYFTAETIKEGVKNQKYGKTVNTKLPKFEFDYDCVLNDTLKSIGVKTAFDKNSADFSKMADIFSEGNIYLDKVFHKTHIAVDEQGTKAAAATAFVLKEWNSIDISEPVSITLDRPFLFAIYDYQEGIPVFIGTVCSL